MPGWHGPRPTPSEGRLKRWTLGDPEFRSDEFDRARRSSPWAGHRWFAYDLVGWLRPARIVELGTHFGCSFFALCQAAVEHDTGSELVAVDTWAGDPHAGFYGDRVFQQVEAQLAQHFPRARARLVRKLFDDALADVADASVDLLHIDGFHTYEAVAHDLSSWEPKLTPEATVLFHDVNPSSGYGSAALWRQLADERGGFAFWHNFGLGVWTLHPGLAELLASDDFAQLARFYPARAQADLTTMSVEDLTAMVDDKQQLIADQDMLIAERHRAIVAQAELVDAKQQIIEHQDVLIADRDEAISSQAALVDTKQALIDHLDQLVAERDGAIRVLSAQVAAAEERSRASEKDATVSLLRRPLLRRR